ncbi:MAG: hypothetical protein WDW36_003179 [Sanguina aurantia]
MEPSVQRFRRLPAKKKEEFFIAAAKLLTGYTDVSFSGEGVTDALLQIVAAKSGSKFERVKIQSSSNVTDVGLFAMIDKASELQHVSVEELPSVITGEFLVRMFEGCPKLRSIALSNLPSLSWAPLNSSSMAWDGGAITKLTVRGVRLDKDFALVLAKLGGLLDLEFDGPAGNIKAASVSCLRLQRLSYQVSARTLLDEALTALSDCKELKQLELVIRNFSLSTDQLHIVGMLPVVEVRLDSYVYRQQPTLSRSSYSHVDNEGVKALVDSICTRWCLAGTDMKPLKLTLCGATALTHDAVSALLRLPILTELDIGGCCRITAMDKMRLVAKVRAGRELLDSGRKPSSRSMRFPGLFL